MKIKILVLFLLCISTEIRAEQPYQIERSQVLEVKSKILGKTYDIAIKLPKNYGKNTTKKYPVLYLTDSGYSFPLVSSLTRQMVGGGKIHDLILVGISYSKEERWDISRTRDYTPTNSPNEQIGFSKEARIASGGANKFLQFISEELFEYVDGAYRTDINKRIYAGHSFGGLLGAYVVKTTPTVFDFYILSDPSLWYDNQVLFGIESNEAKSMKANVLIVSSNPDSQPKRGGFSHNMVANSKHLERQLIDYLAPGSNIKAVICNGQLHETIYPIAITQGLLRFIGK